MGKRGGTKQLHDDGTERAWRVAVAAVSGGQWTLVGGRGPRECWKLP